jgi:hypothetical protein
VTPKEEQRRRLCPVCGAQISISGRTMDDHAIGSCGDAFLPRSRAEREAAGISTEKWPPLVRDAATASLVQCLLCDADFRRVRGIHVGSQRHGMISNRPCERVFVAHGGNMTAGNTRPYLAYVDGEPLRRRSGDARRFASAAAAYAAARRTAPRRWHP